MATIAGEDVALNDQALNLDKITAKPERVGVYVPVTSQALSATNINLRAIVLEREGMAVGAALNKAMFATVAPSAPNNGIGTILAAPYAAPVTSAWAASVPPTLTKAQPTLSIQRHTACSSQLLSKRETHR